MTARPAAASSADIGHAVKCARIRPDCGVADIVRRLREAGLDEVGDASVYGTLRRLYSGGALTSYVVPSDEGPHRKYYGLAARGRTQLTEMTREWRTFADVLERLTTGEGREAA